MNENLELTGEPAKALTNWSKQPTVANLKQDLQDAKPVHDTQIGKIKVWLDNLNITGAAKVKAAKGSSSIVPKLIRKQAEWRYAALSEPYLSTDDIFKLKPVTWEDRQAAQQNQLVLNNQFNTAFDKTAFIDEYVRTAVDEGTVIVRIGWEFHEKEVTKTVPDVEFRINPQFAPMHEHLAKMKEESPSEYEMDVPDELKQAHDLAIEQQQPIEPVILGEKQIKVFETTRNVPTVEVCDYANVVIDPSCKGDVTKARFIIYSFESSMSELKKDGKYKNLSRVNITNNSPLGQPDHKASEGANTFQFSDEPRKRLVVHEYWGFWDIEGTGIVEPIVAAWVGDTLIRMEKNPFPDKQLPFVVVQYLPVRRSVYGEPDGVLIEDNQKVVGAVTRGMIDILGKSANGQTGMRKDMLDATNQRKFENGEDYQFNPQADPRAAVHMHTYPEIPNSAMNMLQLQNMEAESLTGVKSFSQGITGSGLGDVAAGVRGALDAASKREVGILRRLSAGIVAVGRKIMSMNSEFLSETEVVRVTNDQFVTVRRDDLAGNFDLKLTISTAEEDEKKAQELAFMLQTTGPNMDPAMTRMILSDIARLRKMPDLAHKIESFEPTPDPLAQKKAELEVALLEAQIATEQAKAAATMATAGLNSAKVGTEEAKQGHLKSDTDNKNLEFVERESGVTQERDLQKAGEQARSQAQLKVLDHQFTMKEKETDVLGKYIAAKKS